VVLNCVDAHCLLLTLAIMTANLISFFELSVPTDVMLKTRSSVWPEHARCPLAWG